MKQHKSIALAIELAERQRDAARRNIALLERNFQSAQTQLQQLKSYALEKDSSMTTAKVGLFSGETIKYHHQFMGRLQQAIEMQSDLTSRAVKQVDGAKARLVASEIRSETLSRMLMLKNSVERSLAARQEQKQADDFAAQQYARRARELESGESL